MMIDYKDDPRAVLIHFNPNHDPETGRFAKSTYAHIAQKKEPLRLRRQRRMSMRLSTL